LGKVKKGKKKQAAKRANRKNLAIIVSVCIAIAVAISALVVFNVINQQSEARVFTADSQMVTLRDDGTFSAKLAHSVTKSGTYSESITGDTTTISFIYDGKTENGNIVGSVLTLPDEWDDGHGHDTEFTLRSSR
jgi:opacity protein-like surface antigen